MISTIQIAIQYDR